MTIVNRTITIDTLEEARAIYTKLNEKKTDQADMYDICELENLEFPLVIQKCDVGCTNDGYIMDYVDYMTLLNLEYKTYSLAYSELNTVYDYISNIDVDDVGEFATDDRFAFIDDLGDYLFENCNKESVDVKLYGTLSEHEAFEKMLQEALNK